VTSGYADDFFLLITIIYVIDILVRFYGLGWRSFRANGWNIFDVLVASGSLITSISVRIGVNGDIMAQLQKLFLVSIAFKLVQRMNNLNKLFKTAVYAPLLMITIFFLLTPPSAGPVYPSSLVYFRFGSSCSFSFPFFSWRSSA
jgi:hypothetical protein